jgi:hypothetical protein
MSDGISFDFSEISKLAADLTAAPPVAKRNVVAALSHTAFDIKKAWRDKIQGTEGLPVAFLTIDYDVKVEEDTITAEIGSDTGKKQATFVTVIEFGAPGQNLAPRGYGAGALQENQPDFIKGLEIAIGEPLK